MDRPLLNANQQRRVVTHLRLLQEDLADMASWPELARPGDPYAGLRDLIARLRERVESLRGKLGLPPDEGPPLRRRVMATAEVWATSMEDVRARQLKGYGPVHSDLARALDPHLNEIIQLLQGMAKLAASLPER
jgi:hypothetical protein